MTLTELRTTDRRLGVRVPSAARLNVRDLWKIRRKRSTLVCHLLATFEAKARELPREGVLESPPSVTIRGLQTPRSREPISYKKRGKRSKSCWPYFNWHSSNATNLFLISIRPGGNTGRSEKPPGSPASKSSRGSSRHSRLPTAWASRVTFGSGNTCCELAIDT